MKISVNCKTWGGENKCVYCAVLFCHSDHVLTGSKLTACTLTKTFVGEKLTDVSGNSHRHRQKKQLIT